VETVTPVELKMLIMTTMDQVEELVISAAKVAKPMPVELEEAQVSAKLPVSRHAQ